MSKAATTAKKAPLKNRWEAYWERNKKSEGYLFQKSCKSAAVKVCRAIMLFGMCFMILQPLLNKISISFMEEQDLYNAMVISVPEHFTTANYQLTAYLTNYATAFRNTFVISLTIAIVQVGMSTLVGYGFARFNFPLKNFWFACVILTVVIPTQAISTSLYLHFRFFDIFGIIELLTDEALNLRGSVLPYYLMSVTCMGLKNGLYIYLIRQFFRNIPKELEEAAYVDGCGTLKTFIRIMLPDAKPILTSCFLFSFVWQWTDSFYSKTFLGNTSLLSVELSRLGDRLMQYIQIDLRNAAGASVGYTNCIVATGTLMVVVPLLVLYLFAQKGFVESLSSSGIKM